MNELERSIVRQNGAALLAGIGITSAARGEPTRFEDSELDRELQMRISDGFTTQTWVYDGQVWKETADTLALHENECVRINIANDTPVVRVVSAGPGGILRIRPGETAVVDLAVKSLNHPFSIDVVGVPAFSRPLTVRANNRAHASAA